MGKGNFGKKNGNWKGGIAEYPNHYEMKKNRLVKLQQTKAICEICGNRARTIHHKDNTRNNHSLKNLMVLCHSCHGIIHNVERKRIGIPLKHTSKYIRKYGMTLEGMAKKLHMERGTLWLRLNRSKVKGLKKQTLKQIKELKIED